MTTVPFCRSVRCLSVIAFGALGLMAVQALHAQPTAPSRPAAGQSGAGAPPSAELKVLAAVASTNYDQLTKDIDYIGSLIGQPNISQILKAKIDAATSGKGLAGIDQSKPWGLILQTDGMQFLPLICLPVTSVDDVMATIAATGADVTDGEGGMKELSLPTGKVFMKSSGGWAFFSKNSISLARVPTNPQAAFSKLLANYDVAAQVAVQNTPPMYRQMAILAMQSAMQQQLTRQPQESDEEFAARQKTIQAQMQQTVQQLQELDTITLGCLIDAPQKRGVIEFTYKFVPDGELARQFAAYGEPRTRFAGFRQADAAATMIVVAKADPQAIQKDLAQFEAAISGLRTQFNKTVDESADTIEGVKREAIKAAAGQWFDALEATLKAGQVDAAASLRARPNSLALIAGALVQDPAKVESGLKKLDEEFKDSPGFDGIQWNADSHAGVNFHTMTIPVPPLEDGPAKLLGEKADVAFGIGPQAVYVSVGKDNVGALKQAIDASQADPNKLVSPLELTLSFAPLLDVAAIEAKDDAQRNKLQEIAEMLRTEAPGRDHVRVTTQMVPNGVTYRIEAEDGAMRAIAVKAMEAHQHAQAPKVQRPDF